MTLELNAISNSALKKAAENADKNYNGKIDSEELTVFMKSAKQAECNTADILSIVSKVGIDKNDGESMMKLKTLQKMNQLENTIKAKKKELKVKKEEYKDMKPITTAKAVGGTVGAVAYGGGLAAGVGAMLAGAGVALTGPVGIAALGISAIAGGTFGAAWGAAWGDAFGGKSHEAKVSEHQAETYRSKEIAPLESKIIELEEQLQQAQKEFFS